MQNQAKGEEDVCLIVDDAATERLRAAVFFALCPEYKPKGKP